jgi:hypothetical protein
MVVTPDKRLILWALGCVAATLVIGCLGPTSIRSTRSKYNEAVLTTGNEELLLNLVRLRYGEGVNFLPITSINAQFELEAGALGRGGIDRGGESNYGEGHLGFADRPTLTFDSRRSPELTKALLTRFDVETFDLLDAAGWDMDRLFRLLIEEINGVDNARGAGGPTPELAPDFAEYRYLASLVHHLKQQRLLALGVQQVQTDVPSSVSFDAVDAQALVNIHKAGYGVRSLGEKKGFVLTETRPVRVVRAFPSAAGSPELAEVTRILHLVPGLPFYEIELSDGNQGRAADVPAQRTKLTVTMRSLLELMYYLSHAIQVPPEHIEKGLVTITINPDGTPFDWEQLTGDLLRVCVAKHKPKQAAVAVKYRGYWYYIDDADISSKTTLALFRELTRLQKVGAAEGQPLLTLPVGR